MVMNINAVLVKFQFIDVNNLQLDLKKNYIRNTQHVFTHRHKVDRISFIRIKNIFICDSFQIKNQNFTEESGFTP